MAEVIRYAEIPNDGSININRCGLTGWIVHINGCDRSVMGQSAAFSNASDLLDWLTKSIRPESRGVNAAVGSVSTPEVKP